VNFDIFASKLYLKLTPPSTAFKRYGCFCWIISSQLELFSTDVLKETFQAFHRHNFISFRPQFIPAEVSFYHNTLVDDLYDDELNLLYNNIKTLAYAMQSSCQLLDFK